MYKIIEIDAKAEIIVKKSKFLGFLFNLKNEFEIEPILNAIKKEHNNATHICYAYILKKDTFKSFDDGEPASSAGIPILNVLKSNKLVYTLAVVVRYFGGIKLGVGGLKRAYSTAIKETIKETKIIDFIIKNDYVLESDYKNYEFFIHNIEKYDGTIIGKKFDLKVLITFSISDEQLLELKKAFNIPLKIKKVD